MAPGSSNTRQAPVTSLGPHDSPEGIPDCPHRAEAGAEVTWPVSGETRSFVLLTPGPRASSALLWNEEAFHTDTEVAPRAQSPAVPGQRPVS